jgi:hypothetical protein
MQFRTESGEMAKLMAMTASPPQLIYWDLSPLAAAQV